MRDLIPSDDTNASTPSVPVQLERSYSSAVIRERAPRYVLFISSCALVFGALYVFEFLDDPIDILINFGVFALVFISRDFSTNKKLHERRGAGRASTSLLATMESLPASVSVAVPNVPDPANAPLSAYARELFTQRGPIFLVALLALFGIGMLPLFLTPTVEPSSIAYMVSPFIALSIALVAATVFMTRQTVRQIERRTRINDAWKHLESNLPATSARGPALARRGLLAQSRVAIDQHGALFAATLASINLLALLAWNLWPAFSVQTVSLYATMSTYVLLVGLAGVLFPSEGAIDEGECREKLAIIEELEGHDVVGALTDARHTSAGGLTRT